MTLDLSKLSPMFRRRLCGIIATEARQHVDHIEEYLRCYPEVATKEECAAYALASRRLATEATAIGKRSK